MKIRAIAAVGLAAGLLLSGPAWSQDTDDEAGDPLEPINRVVSGFNSIFRTLLLDPLVDGYQAVTPEFIQEGLSNATSNLTEPVTIGSSLLQGDFENAGTAAERFIINSTIGIGGLVDPASDMGLEQRQEDLGQAFAAHGVGAGPHIVVPTTDTYRLKKTPSCSIWPTAGHSRRSRRWPAPR